MCKSPRPPPPLTHLLLCPVHGYSGPLLVARVLVRLRTCGRMQQVVDHIGGVEDYIAATCARKRLKPNVAGWVVNEDPALSRQRPPSRLTPGRVGAKLALQLLLPLAKQHLG